MASINILMEYFDYANILLTDLAIKLPKNIGINKYTIKLIEGKQALYRPTYTLRKVKLEILKAYIKTHLKTEVI